jgi:glycosyltransferase involved in cell wall biosynthesis
MYGKIVAYMQENSRRILILTTAYLPQVGGSELAIKNITERLPEFEFDLITSRFSPDVPASEKIGNVNVYRVGNSLSRLSFLLPKNFLPIAIFAKARQLMAQQGAYGLIHAYQASQAAGGGWLLKWIYPRIPFVVTVQEGKVLASQSALTRFFRYLIFKKMDAATAISAYLAAYITSQNKNLPVEIIPNGVDAEKFKSDTMDPRDTKTLITSSRLVEKNAIGDLIDAFALVSEKVPDAKLIIIGDGDQRSILEEKIQTLGLDNKVTFLGEISHDLLPQHLARATVFVRPSRSEGLGTAFLEAMAVGIPVVGTPVGGIVDFLEDGQTGLLCKVGDAQDIAEKLITLLSNEELRQSISVHAKELIRDRYTWQGIAESFRNFYGTFAKN